MRKQPVLWICLMGVFLEFAAAGPSPELPGEEITETDQIIKKSEGRVSSASRPRDIISSSTWRSAPIDQQLSRDKTLIGMGYGALFIPAYTEPRLEPEITVRTAHGKKSISAQSGERVLLEQGEYIARIGSGGRDRTLSYSVTIVEGHTTIIQPDWAGLVVETINPNYEYVREEYEIYSINTSIPYGKGYGLEEERLEDIKTWILAPGLYRITKVGEDLTSLTNYITVQLNPGELSVVELVFDDETGSLIAGGIKGLQARTKAGTNWQYGLRLGGNVNFFSKIINSHEDDRSTTMLLDMNLRAKYDNSKYMGLNIARARNKFRKEKGSPFSSEVDDLQLRSTWVRRINNWMGPYARGKVSSHIFPTEYSDTAYVTSSAGDTLRTLSRNEKFELEPPLSPVEFSEGLGINLEYSGWSAFEFSTQIGAAAKQYITQERWVRISSPNRPDIIRPDKPDASVGMENIINTRLRPHPRISIDVLTDLFFPLYPNFKLSGNYLNFFQMDDFIVDCRLNLTRHIEISYIYELTDTGKPLGTEEKDSDYRFEHSHNVLLRVSLNI